MREIVHIQAGQCGNQIGAKVRAIALLVFVACLNFDSSRNPSQTYVLKFGWKRYLDVVFKTFDFNSIL